MNKKNLLPDRIEINPEIMVGKPVIKGTRLTVELIVGLLEAGWPTHKILNEYDHISAEDIAACQTYAQTAAQSRIGNLD